MEVYYGKTTDGKTILLSDDEAHHLLHVRRAKAGEQIDVTDGEGYYYRCEIVEVQKQNCLIEIISSTFTKPTTARLHLVIAPTKNMDRMEWLVEKGTEIGIEEFSFVQCRRSERKEIRVDRLEKIALAAMKQSMKAYLPVLNPMIPFQKFIDKKPEGERFICTMSATDEFINMHKPEQNVTILIGPEGDFHTDEIASALESGFIKASLGHQRFRTETAALVSCMMVNLSKVNK